MRGGGLGSDGLQSLLLNRWPRKATRSPERSAPDLRVDVPAPQMSALGNRAHSIRLLRPGMRAGPRAGSGAREVPQVLAPDASFLPARLTLDNARSRQLVARAD